MEKPDDLQSVEEADQALHGSLMSAAMFLEKAIQARGNVPSHLRDVAKLELARLRLREIALIIPPSNL